MTDWPGQEVSQIAPVFTAPADPFRTNSDARDAVRTDIAVSGEGRAERGEQRTVAQTEFGNLDTLRQRYDAQPAVKEYRAILPLLMTGLQAAPDATGDNTLLYAYARVMDPGSVVRESEMGMASSGASVFDSQVAGLKKQFGIDGGGNLPPAVRERLKRDMNQKAAEMGRSYLMQRQRFGQEAEAAGLDPIRVVGPHDSEPFRQRYYAVMDDLGIDVSRPALNADQERTVQAFWNANRGNTTLTPDAVRKWYADNGIPAPSSPDIERAIAEAGGGASFAGLNPERQSAPEPGRRVSGDDPAYEQFAAGVGDIAQAAGDVVGLVGNPLNQTINWLTGSNLSTDLGETLRTDVLGLPHGNQTIEAINRSVAGSFIPGAAAARVAPALGRGVAGASVRELGASPVRDAIAGGTAGAAGEVAKAAGAGPVGQTAAILAGGGAGALAGGRIAPALVERPPLAPMPTAPRPETSAERYAAGQDFGLDMSVGDARPMGSRVMERSLDAQPASAGVMDASRQRLAGQIEGAVEKVADSYGPATSFRGMGEAAQRGAKNWMTRFDEVTGKLYDAIPIKPETGAVVDNSRAALRDLTEGFSSNPELRNATQSSQIVRYRQALENGGLSWGDLKAFRTLIGEQVGEALLSDGTRKSQLRALYGALSKDMEATADQIGPGAVRAFRRANDAYAAGQQRIDDAISSLIGNAQDRSPEAAAQFLQRIAREGRGSGDLKALADVRKTLKPDEWSQVSNAFIRLMGQPANSAGREFSPATFVRVYDDMAPEAKNLLFGGSNKALRQNLDRFVGVIRNLAENDATRNTSRTAFGLGGVMSSGLGAAAGASIGGLPGALLGVALTNSLQFGAAKLWTNPGFVRWATGYAKMMRAASKNGGRINPQAHENQLKALGRLAASNTIIAGEARDLQSQLAATFQQGPGRAAAQGGAQSEGSTGTTGETQ